MSRGPIPDFPRDRPTVPEVMPLVKRLFELEPVGGNMHIVLDDGNLGVKSIKFCLEVALHEQDGLCITIASCMLLMTPTQRRKLLYSYY